MKITHKNEVTNSKNITRKSFVYNLDYSSEKLSMKGFWRTGTVFVFPSYDPHLRDTEWGWS